ncbi:flagellar protein FlgN [Paenibacillus sp. N1-5-1-14]|uniref:flagellar protein FlgN n=1 Tax=Paenibacillus radicibacter TaxID=2972488 RepID=UPI002158D397|nr:flagellar protein FlgN [Paenibacillus radicibacter]MCR8645044.1 flagellar protein FlgN [Paenibacillus radicibacter]
MSITALLEVMGEITEVHTELLALAKEKTPLLVRNEVEELNRVIHKENNCIKRMTELDQSRLHFLGEYLVKRGYHPNPKVTISDLIRIIYKAEEKQSLTDAQVALAKVIAELQTVNTLNQEMIKQSLAFIDYSLDLLVGSPENEVTYQHPAMQKQTGTRAGVFNAKA